MTNGINNVETLAPPAGQAISPESCKTLHILPTPVHVLFVIDELCELGGAERILLKMVRLLPKDLFRCSVVTFRIREDLEELTEIGCPLYVFPLKKTYDFNALRMAMRLRNLIRREKVSIVHTFFETSDLWAGLVARLSGCPVLISSRRDMGILRSGKHRAAYKLMARFYDKVLAVSPQVRDFCVRHDGLRPEQVEILMNGLELDTVFRAQGRAVMRRRHAIADQAPVVVTVANIRRVKGLDVLVRASKLVCRKHPKAIFLVIGKVLEEDYRRRLERMIAEAGMAGNFRFMGGREDVCDLLKMGDVFCLPSRSEGFSNALIEAMACRLPCVATDVGGNQEAVEDWETGFIVNNEDWRGMAERLTILLDDRELAVSMGRKAEAVVRAKFTAEAMMGRITGVYRDMLAERRRG